MQLFIKITNSYFSIEILVICEQWVGILKGNFSELMKSIIFILDVNFRSDSFPVSS